MDLGFKVGDKVMTRRAILAGLRENGPKVCEKGETGYVVRLDERERDGVHVRFSSGVDWWCMPKQIELDDR